MLCLPNKILSVYCILFSYNKILPALLYGYTKAHRQIHKLMTKAVILYLKYFVYGILPFLDLQSTAKLMEFQMWHPKQMDIVWALRPCVNDFFFYGVTLLWWKIPDMPCVRVQTTLSKKWRVVSSSQTACVYWRVCHLFSWSVYMKLISGLCFQWLVLEHR